jgi:hypothetical protein
MSNDATVVPIPIACDLTDAPDTAEERMAEYARLFARSLTGRERTGRGVQLRFRADDGVAAWVRDLAAREKACCPFYDFAVAATDSEVRWDISLADGATADEDTAHTLLDEFYYAPDNVAAGVPGMRERLAANGYTVTTTGSGAVMRLDRAGGTAVPRLDTPGAGCGDDRGVAGRSWTMPRHGGRLSSHVTVP